MKILADIHTHTVASGHAYSTLDENLRYAAEIGLEMMAMTDHAPALRNTTSATYFANLGILPETLHGVRLLKGVELNIINPSGEIDLPVEFLEKMDIALASLHIPTFPPATRAENTSAYLKAMENPLVDIIGHPGDPRYDVDYKEVFRVAKETGTLLEFNNASLVPGGFRQGGDAIILEIMKMAMEDGIPVVVGSDAHFYTSIGNVSYVETMMKSIGFPEELVLNTNPELLLASLKRRKCK
ncbi:phosphatase [Chakrabartyella piscis]|uniref:phosphatase n=1 Tax=Chakrabartyella piscis TaxID=2918914 RepID=UPI002958BAA2|nr:phosphatase [Chakrabartyella piscis]